MIFSFFLFKSFTSPPEQGSTLWRPSISRGRAEEGQISGASGEIPNCNANVHLAFRLYSYYDRCTTDLANRETHVWSRKLLLFSLKFHLKPSMSSPLRSFRWKDLEPLILLINQSWFKLYTGRISLINFPGNYWSLVFDQHLRGVGWVRQFTRAESF